MDWYAIKHQPTSSLYMYSVVDNLLEISNWTLYLTQSVDCSHSWLNKCAKCVELGTNMLSNNKYILW